MQPGYSIPFQDVALVGGTAKTVVSLAASKVATAKSIALTCDGVTATNVPILIEVCRGDGTSAGTSTSVTPVQYKGRPMAAGSTGAKNYSAEPTVLTQIFPMRVSPTSGILEQYPLGDEVEGDSTTNKLIAIRLTAGSAVNVTGWLAFEE